MTRARVYAAIDAERARQSVKWSGRHDWGAGDCSSPDVDRTVKLGVLGEEFGEVARAVLDRNHPNLVAELVQVAAVAVAWLELEMSDDGRGVSELEQERRVIVADRESRRPGPNDVPLLTMESAS